MVFAEQPDSATGITVFVIPGLDAPPIRPVELAGETLGFEGPYRNRRRASHEQSMNQDGRSWHIGLRYVRVAAESPAHAVAEA